jgi:hypothetical protein
MSSTGKTAKAVFFVYTLSIEEIKEKQCPNLM